MKKKKASKTPKKESVTVSMGRPTKYDPGFHPMEAERIMKSGKHLMCVASEFNIHRATIYEWIEKYPDFSDAIKRGKSHLEAFFYNKFMVIAEMPSAMVNTAALIFLTKNAIGWKDKVEHSINDESITDLVFE